MVVFELGDDAKYHQPDILSDVKTWREQERKDNAVNAWCGDNMRRRCARFDDSHGFVSRYYQNKLAAHLIAPEIGEFLLPGR